MKPYSRFGTKRAGNSVADRSAPLARGEAQSDDPKALQKALVGNTYQDWSGKVKFEDTPGVKWHNVSPPHLILQETEVRQPFTESHLVYPTQFGGDGKIEGP